MNMQIEDIGKRITELRMKKGVSARDMSLSIGMGPAYINNVENGKSMISMEVLFYICEYFQITPAEFFDEECKEPTKAYSVMQEVKKLNSNQLDVIQSMIEQMK